MGHVSLVRIQLKDDVDLAKNANMSNLVKMKSAKAPDHKFDLFV